MISRGDGKDPGEGIEYAVAAMISPFFPLLPLLLASSEDVVWTIKFKFGVMCRCES